MWSGVGISTLFLFARLWIRLRVFRKLQPDDPLVIFAWILSIANAAIWTAVRKDLYFNLALATGQITTIPADLFERLERLLRGNLAAYILSYVSLWSIKISFVVFFRRFGDKLRTQRIAWYATLGFCLASFAVCLGTVDYRCLTASGMNMLQVCMEPRTTSFEFVTLRLTTALDVVTDFAIILLLTNVLWRIHLPVWTKAALAGIFSLTVFVITIAIVRVVIAPLNGKLDLSWLVCMNAVEVAVALIVVSCASFRILYTSSQQNNSAKLAAAKPSYGSGLSSEKKSASSKTSERSLTAISDDGDDKAGSRNHSQDQGSFSWGERVPRGFSHA